MEKKKVFVIRYINSEGKQEMRGTSPTIEALVDDLAKTLHLLKTLPEGVKIEITFAYE